MKEYKDVVFGREYGTEGKKSWTKCGVLIIDHDSDRMSLKIEVMPVDFNGWFSIFDQKKKEDRQQRQSNFDDDDTPF